MRTLATTIAIGLLSTGAALACDDHFGTCQIEDWRWYQLGDSMVVDGVTTCDTGQIRFRVYEGQGESARFLGIDRAYIKGHTFKALVSRISPSAPSIKYSIEPGR